MQLSHRVPVCSLLCKRFNMALDRVKWGKYPKKCTLIEYGVNVFSLKVLIFDVCPESSFLSYCVARNFCRKFCGSFLFWRIGDFLCFATRIDCFLFLGTKFLRFSETTQYPALTIFSFSLSTYEQELLVRA